MNQEQEFFDALDRFDSGELEPSERLNMELKLAGNSEWRTRAEEHRKLRASMKSFAERTAVLKSLNAFHEAYTLAPVVTSGPIRKESILKRYLPHLAVAASVAIVSIVGTLITLRSMEEKQTAYYKELRRIVDKNTKDLKNVQGDLAATKPKDDRFAGKYSGTGFLISSGGYIVTSYHVIKGADSVYVQNEVMGGFKAGILFSDAENDVAILKIADPAFRVTHGVPFRINPDEANLGENVYTLGYPREDIVFGEGSVSASTGYRQNENAYQVSVPVNPGNSGGPLMNEQGDIIGIISGIQTETSGAAFAIKSKVLLTVIKEIPDSLKTTLKMPVKSYLRGAGKVQQIKRWKEFVFMVRVYNGK